jgi:hypothetical protein
MGELCCLSCAVFVYFYCAGGSLNISFIILLLGCAIIQGFIFVPAQTSARSNTPGYLFQNAMNNTCAFFESPVLPGHQWVRPAAASGKATQCPVYYLRLQMQVTGNKEPLLDFLPSVSPLCPSTGIWATRKKPPARTTSTTAATVSCRRRPT